jgi:signal transduction histidine kinase
MKNTQFFEEEVQRRTEELVMAKEEKSQLLNILSHDLSTPILILDINLQAIKRKNLIPDEHLRYLEKSLFSMDRIKSMLSEVKLMSSVEIGKTEIPMEEIDLDEVISTCHDLFIDQVKDKDISFKLENQVSSKRTFLANNTILVSNIISNFISNSIKFTQAGEQIKLIIKELVDSNEISIVISDTGNGMKREKLNQIYSGDKKSENGTDGEKGTGLGLSVALFYIKRLGGRFSIDSKPIGDYPNEHGTQITLRFGIL